jgi:hypothetical protein
MRTAISHRWPKTLCTRNEALEAQLAEDRNKAFEEAARAIEDQIFEPHILITRPMIVTVVRLLKDKEPSK